jgi:hypothetical protein
MVANATLTRYCLLTLSYMLAIILSDSLRDFQRVMKNEYD